MKLMRFLLGLGIGAGIALLFAPKSGRALRQQLAGGASGTLLSAAPDEYPQPEPVTDWGAPAVAVAEAPSAVEEQPADVAEPVVETPPWEAPAEEPSSDDLRSRIDETRAAVETELTAPFADDAVDEAVLVAAASEAVAEEAVADAAVAEIVAEEAVEEAVISEEVAEEAVAEALGAEAVAEEAAAAAAAAVLVAEVAAAEAEAAEEVAEEAVAEAVVAEEVAEDAVVEAEIDEAVAEEAVVEAVVAEEVAEEAVAEEVAAEEVTDGAVETTPAEEAPREGGSIDQAEMRRRIEETRARLKAKAFDAMMSGEAALLSRDSGDKPVPTADGAEVELDAETDTVIDESLSQEEY